MVLLRNVLCAGFIFILAGCAPMTVTTNYDTSANFTKLKTFDWIPNATINVNDPRVIDSLLESNIKNAVLNELSQKGYEKTSKGTPDFYVAYNASLEAKTRDITLTNYYGYPGYPDTWGYWWGGPTSTETYTVTYDEGMLVVDFVDPETKQPIWRGTVQAQVTLTDTPKCKQNKINEAIKKILAKFPPTLEK